ncbi:MAG: 7-cyano-7-deazaguanine synthase QueC [Nitrospirae bacterium]|nr:7-cyano-7-deazaguanine synthase QueC [Nitrospirota bacterium]
MNGAVVLLSGGIDSATTAAIAKTEGFDIYALSFDYGQRHRIELDSARKIALALSAKKHLIINFNLRDIGNSALTADEIEVPKDRIQDKKNHASCIMHHASFLSIPITYVPARNTIFLSFALAWAETIEAENIFIGANAIDYSGYPDCRPEFIKSFEAMANLATKAGVEGKSCFKINTPLINLTKGEIIKKGMELDIDYSLTWSCYDPQISDKLQVTSNKLKNNKNLKDSSLVTRHSLLIPCKRCDSCLLRAKGFREAGIEDPLMLKVKT